MSDKFDPYREALVMETKTVSPGAFLEDLDEVTKQRVAAALHGQPESAGSLKYVRISSGFCREITVTDEDVQRISG